MNIAPILAFWTPSFPELMIIMIIALLLFGKRLPDVARSLGKGVVEFKKGLRGIEDDSDRPAPYQPPKQEQSYAAPVNPPPPVQGVPSSQAAPPAESVSPR
jgi:sec-independent protein translocase protein TatA